MRYKITTIICLLIFNLIIICPSTSFAVDEVVFECENLENALLSYTNDKPLTIVNMSRIYGDVDLRDKEITSVVGLEYLTNASNLILTGNYIEDLTPLLELIYLKELSINYNNIKIIPKGFSQFKQLENFDISANPITSLPDDINEFDDLKWLAIDYCNLSKISDIDGLGDTLEWLSMPGNPIEDFSFIASLNALELLNINQCELDVIPNLSKNENLHYLYVANNNINELPTYLSEYKMMRIDASNNNISDIPDSYEKLTKIEQLILTNNYIYEFPIEIFKMKNLRVLMLGQNMIREIPAGLFELKLLQRLSFTGNDISSLEGYSEFKIPYSYQLGFSYNHLDLNDDFTKSVLADNHITASKQKTGKIDSTVENAFTNNTIISVEFDLDDFIELKDIEYNIDEIVILDRANNMRVIPLSVHDIDNLRVSLSNDFEIGTNLDLRVLLAITIDTWPTTQLYYYDDIAISLLRESPTPAPTLVPTSTTEPTLMPVVSEAPVVNEVIEKEDITVVDKKSNKILLLVLTIILAMGVVTCGVFLYLIFRKRG